MPVEHLQYHGSVVTVPWWNFYGTVVEFEKVWDFFTAVVQHEKNTVSTPRSAKSCGGVFTTKGH